jgi:hypothetical protein
MCTQIKQTRLKPLSQIFSEFVWFEYKVSGVMCSVSECEHCYCIEGWIHSQRRNRFDQKLVGPLMNTKSNPKFKCGFFKGYRLDLFRVKTRVSSCNLYTTPFFSYP